MTLDLKKLTGGEVSVVGFDCELSLAGISGDIINGTANAHGEVKNHSGYILLTGEMKLSATAVCARCAEEFPYEQTITLNIPLAESLIDTESDEYVLLDESVLELTELLSDQIVLSLPSKLLCKSDCKGLCQKCGANLNQKACGCSEKDADPRWAKLKDFFTD